MDIIVRGANDLALLSARLKAAGNGGLRRELLAGIRRAAKPMAVAAQRGALEDLPKRGGLNEAIAASKFGIRTRTAGSSPGVRVIGRSATGRHRDLKALDAGFARHPVFGNRDVWRTTRVRPGWFTARMEQQAPGVRVQILAAIHNVGRKL